MYVLARPGEILAIGENDVLVAPRGGTRLHEAACAFLTFARMSVRETTTSIPYTTDHTGPASPKWVMMEEGQSAPSSYLRYHINSSFPAFRHGANL